MARGAEDERRGVTARREVHGTLTCRV
jgi:hypothetical protein